MAKDIASATSVVVQRDRVLYGVPPQQAQQAQQLTDDILSGLRTVQTAIDSRCVPCMMIIIIHFQPVG